jgi:hypothetical protein
MFAGGVHWSAILAVTRSATAQEVPVGSPERCQRPAKRVPSITICALRIEAQRAACLGGPAQAVGRPRSRRRLCHWPSRTAYRGRTGVANTITHVIQPRADDRRDRGRGPAGVMPLGRRDFSGLDHSAVSRVQSITLPDHGQTIPVRDARRRWGACGPELRRQLVGITDGDTIRVMHDGVAERVRL